MGFGWKLNQPTRMAERPNHADEFRYWDSIGRPPTIRGKHHLSLPPKPRQTPFRPRYEDGNHDKYVYGYHYNDESMRKARGRSASFDDRAGSGRLSRCSSRSSDSPRGRRTLHFDKRGPPSYRDSYDDAIRHDRLEDGYRGGYDFRDDVDSIDSEERERRRRHRCDLALREQRLAAGRGLPPTVNSLKKLPRFGPHDSVRASIAPVSSPRNAGSYGLRHPPQYSRMSNIYELRNLGTINNGSFLISPTEPSSRFSSRREKLNAFRDVSTESSTIATSEDDLSLNRTMSSCTYDDSYTNPQFLHAKAVPGLPPGYLQRNDGVVISFGSSIDSRLYDERYGDAAPLPEAAAENVVEDLRAMGYTVDEKNGVLISDSESAAVSRYGIPNSEAPSNASKSKSSIDVEDRSQSQKLIQNPSKHASLGSRSAPAITSHDKASESRASTGSRLSGEKPAGRAAIRSQSDGAHSLGSQNDATSVVSGGPKAEANSVAPVGSRENANGRELRMLIQRSHDVMAAAKMMTVNDLAINDPRLEGSQADDFDETDEGYTTLADGSTLTSLVDSSVGHLQRQVIVDMGNTPLEGSTGPGHAIPDPAPSMSGKSNASNMPVDSTRKSPEVTSDGFRVPEIVSTEQGFGNRSVGTSTISSATYLSKKHDSVAVSCERLLYSLQIAACHKG